MTGERAEAENCWRILVVDDDTDVHSVTRLVLKNRVWRKQKFELTSVYSQAEAVALLRRKTDFHVAVLDVVMEKQDSGLVLCGLIREMCPRSTRIILRTGQAGLIPEETVLNEYDIDYYMHKLDMSPERLFSVVRACLRSSQDISTLLAYGRQLQSFTRALQHVSTADDLVVFMGEALQFLELKHNCSIFFHYDLLADADAVIQTAKSARLEDQTEKSARLEDQRVRYHEALARAHHKGLAMMREHLGPELGLDGACFVVVFEARQENPGREGDTTVQPALGGLVFVMDSDESSEKARRDLAADARLFIENWCIAFSTLRLRERLDQEQMLRNQMYHDRLESIAAMVTGVAHELNTPLGVARTAGSIVSDIGQAVLAAAEKAGASDEGARTDLVESIRLMNKNLDRAYRLIQSFRKLSASQLSDERDTISLKGIVEDCVETMGPDLKKSRIIPVLHFEEDSSLLWDGYPGHLSQVLVNLMQNAIRYAYEPGRGGPVQIAVTSRPRDNGFSITFADQGRGVREEIKPRIFDPFVTSGRDTGGTGLGLAITHNIVTNLLNGQITCDSAPGKGARFVIDLPLKCPERALTSGASFAMG